MEIYVNPIMTTYFYCIGLRIWIYRLKYLVAFAGKSFNQAFKLQNHKQ